MTLLATASIEAPLGSLMFSDPTPDLRRIGVVQRRRPQRALRVVDEGGCEACADQLNTGVGEDAGLVRRIGHDPDVHQLRQRIDGVVALIHQRRGERIGRAQALKLGVDLRDLGQIGVGLSRRIADVLIDIGAKGLDPLRRRIQLLGQRLRRRQRHALRRGVARTVRQRLQRGGEVVERGFKGAVAARRAVDALQLAQDIRRLVGIGAAGSFRAQLTLDEQIELTVDAGGDDGRADAAAGDLDLVGVLGDVTRGLRVRDVRRDDRKRRLGGAQTGHRGGEGRTQTHLCGPP